MHFRAALAAALGALILHAQTPEDPEVVRAKLKLDYVRALAEQGIATRAQVDSAQLDVTEAQEAAFLKRTLYGNDVTEAEADEMVQVAERRMARRAQAVARQQQLVEQGVAPRLSVNPLVEKADWARKEHDYTVTRARLIHDTAEMAREEAVLQAKLEHAPAEAQGLAERYDGNGRFTSRDFEKVNRAFERAFSKTLPVSANGETAVHRALGFDHRGRVDVAVSPDQPEGIWLRQYLAANHIPYFAFRAAVHGKATGPHIHIGPMSTHVVQGG